ncbi:MAG: phosphate ABC transporter permease PstA [Bacillota bacterium]|nr:phosphate ABC transporter permease PstA [Bacillota bacterium]
MNRNKRAKIADNIATIFLYIIAILVIVLLTSITVYLVYRGIKSYIPKYMSFSPDGLGIQLFNTLYMVLLSIIISAPLGICAGIYMAEYAKPSKLTDIVRMSIETLASLPSIVVGIFGFLVFVMLTHSTWNMFAGVLTLSILCVPLLTRVTEDGLNEIDQSMKEGSYALGATKWQTIVHVLLPAILPRLVTGIILAAGRGFGEAAALIYTAGLTSDVSFSNWNPSSITSPLNIFRTSDTLAVRIWYLKGFAINPDKYQIADMAAAMLIILVFIFNIGARITGRVIERKMIGSSAIKSKKKSKIN